jgi:hypothetical protein
MLVYVLRFSPFYCYVTDGELGHKIYLVLFRVNDKVLT